MSGVRETHRICTSQDSVRATCWREAPAPNYVLAIALFAAIIGAYVVVFLFNRFAFRATISISAPAVSAPGSRIGLPQAV
jgi:hypothetical protein